MKHTDIYPNPHTLKIGDTVWIFNIDRRDKTNDRHGEVTKIGKKYIYVKAGYKEIRFYTATLRHDNGACSPCYQLYASQQACEYHLKTEKRRFTLANHLFRFLMDEEVNELYEKLSSRDNQ